MTIFISHAPADAQTAEAVETFLERRGHFVERDDGETAQRPLQPRDLVVLLHSKDFVFAPFRMRLEQRALDAWAEGRLILVKLDHNFAPVGLRDLPALDASFEAQREHVWNKLAMEISERLRPAPPMAGAPAPAPSQIPRSQAPGMPQRPPMPRKIPQSRGPWWFGWLIAIPGFIALGVIGFNWLANRVAASPPTIADIIKSLSDLGVHYGLPVNALPIGLAVALAMLVSAPIIVMLDNSLRRRKRDEISRTYPEINEDHEGPVLTRSMDPMREQAPSDGFGGGVLSQQEAAKPEPDAIFVSYARVNAPIVLPVCEGVKQAGKHLWMDKDGISAGESWAGEIVRAIKGAHDVMIMCSKAAFESDHVKREIYLADRYRKRMLPVFIEDATPPEDFEYFFAGVQWLKLHETPEAERPAAVLKALGNA